MAEALHIQGKAVDLGCWLTALRGSLSDLFCAGCVWTAPVAPFGGLEERDPDHVS